MAIHYAKDGHVVTITIDRPEARNSLDVDHFGMLADCWVRFRDDADAFVAILTGVGDVYCVGADLKKFVPIVTERADKLAAGESTLAVGESRYSMAHSLVAVLRDGALRAGDRRGVQAVQAGDRGDQRHLRGRRARDDVEHRPARVRRHRLVPARGAAPRPLSRRRLDRAQRPPALVVQRDGGPAARRPDHAGSGRSRWDSSTASCRATG